MAMNDREAARRLGLDDILSDVSDKWSSAPFESGFTRNVVLAAFFIAFVMLPGLIYMGLAVGTDIGSGAEWVTVLLFLELARRSYRRLSRQELYITMHMASSLTSIMGGVMLGGGLFAHLLWRQYLRSSEAYRNFNLTDQMPQWFAPTMDMLQDRTFIHEAWLPAIAVAFITMLLGKMQFYGLGYILFRITSDIEKLPFPLTRVAAEGATALAESEDKEKESWRWPVFSVLAILGALWGLIYMGIPTLTSVLFGKPTHLIPIPFLDLTPYTEGIFPASAWAVGFNLGLVLSAFVLPWRVLVGSTVTCILCQAILPPLLYRANVLHQWQPGFSALDTQIANSLDLWLSVGIGGALSLALTGIWLAWRSIKDRKRDIEERRSFDWSALWKTPKGRGDWPIWLAILLEIVSSMGYVILCHGLVNLGWFGGLPKPPEDHFPLWILIAFALIWTPINSYIHAQLQGISGHAVSLPFIREGSFILSGYRYPDIWVAPIPLHDLGGAAASFKTLELTRVRFSSLVKVDIMVILLLSAAGFFYWSYIWHLGSIPSATYPYAQEMWPYIAKNSALWTSALGEGNNQMLDAIQPWTIAGSLAIFTTVFVGLNLLGLPLAYYYGAVGGVGQFPYVALTLTIGMGVRFMAAKRLGKEDLRRYAPVMLAGFAAGFGISGMVIVSIVLINSAVSALMY